MDIKGILSRLYTVSVSVTCNSVFFKKLAYKFIFRCEFMCHENFS